jgi:hypothetical protein
MDSLPTLPAPAQQLWLAFLAIESRLDRARVLEALRAFVASTSGVDRALLEQWSLSLVEAVMERGAGLVLRGPLLDALLLPALICAHRAGAARPSVWLARLSDELFRRQALQAELGHPGRVDLFRTALDRNPQDEPCRRELVDALADGFRNSLHELPSGVLFGNNGATRQECAVLTDELRLFESLLTEAERAEHKALRKQAQFHFAAYAAWQRIGTGSYADYLETLSQQSNR